MDTKIVFFKHNESNWWEKFYTRALELFSRSKLKHVGYVNTETGMFYEMAKTFRERPFAGVVAEAKSKGDVMYVVDSPVEITAHTTRSLMLAAGSGIQYGVVDYILFAIRPIYRFFGKPVRNFGGWICSEVVHLALQIEGWSVSYKSVPSPGDLYRDLKSQGMEERIMDGIV